MKQQILYLSSLQLLLSIRCCSPKGSKLAPLGHRARLLLARSILMMIALNLPVLRVRALTTTTASFRQHWQQHYYPSGTRTKYTHVVCCSVGIVKCMSARYYSTTAECRKWRGSRLSTHAGRRTLSACSSSSEADNDSSVTKKRNRRFISYITDIEGDRDYLNRYVENSKILHWRATTHADDSSSASLSRLNFPYAECIDFSLNNCDDILVFGGDIWDQGGSDLFAIRQMLHLKRRHPDRVYFVAGNRDLNKMRMVQELGPANDGSGAAPHHPGVAWLQGTGRTGDPLLGPLDRDPVQRLQWMLAQTMGSPKAFQHRRWELQQERRAMRQHDLVQDEDVVESYRQSCCCLDTGEMAEYLQSCQLVLRLGEVAFVHGALPLTNHLLEQSLERDNDVLLWDDLTFAMPWLEEGKRARDVGVVSIDDWIVALNEFGQRHVQAWRNYGVNDGEASVWAYTGGYRVENQPFGPLLQYGMGTTPDRLPNPTVVYNSWGVSPRIKSGKVADVPRKLFRHDVMRDPIDRAYVRHAEDFFQRTGLRLVCSGHQPVGDLPNHIRISSSSSLQESPYWILVCDTSYSGDMLFWNLPTDDGPPIANLGRGTARSGRGSVAVSEVLIEQCCSSGVILDAYCHGVLSDGTAYESEHIFGGDARADSSILGLTVGTLASGSVVPSQDQSPHHGPWWTQAALADGSYLLAAGKGFKFWSRRIRP